MEEPLSTYAMFILGSIFSMYFFLSSSSPPPPQLLWLVVYTKLVVWVFWITLYLLPTSNLQKKKSKVKVRGGEKEREKKKEEGREKKDNHTTKTKKKLVPVCIWCRYGIQTVYYVKQLVFINISTISFYNCIYHFIHPI